MEQKVKIVLNGKEVDMATLLTELKANRIKTINSKTGFSDRCSSSVIRKGETKAGVIFRGRFDVECIGQDGNLKWHDTGYNDVVNEGLNHILDVILGGDDASAKPVVAPWYIGLTDGTPTVAAADTLSSHGGWVEITDYAGTRKEYIDVRTNQSVSNSDSVGSFAINGGVTVGGAFLASVASGSLGVLLCAEVFTGGDRAVVDGDTINVTYTFTAADS